MTAADFLKASAVAAAGITLVQLAVLMAVVLTTGWSGDSFLTSLLLRLLLFQPGTTLAWIYRGLGGTPVEAWRGGPFLFGMNFLGWWIILVAATGLRKVARRRR